MEAGLSGGRTLAHLSESPDGPPELLRPCVLVREEVAHEAVTRLVAAVVTVALAAVFVTVLRRSAITALLGLLLILPGCGGAEGAGGWSQTRLERCINRSSEVLGILHTDQMTSAQREGMEAIAPGIQVDFLNHEFADIFFTSGKHTSSEIIRSLNTRFSDGNLQRQTWADHHVVVNVIGDTQPARRNVSLLRACEQEALKK